MHETLDKNELEEEQTKVKRKKIEKTNRRSEEGFWIPSSRRQLTLQSVRFVLEGQGQNEPKTIDSFFQLFFACFFLKRFDEDLAMMDSFTLKILF